MRYLIQALSLAVLALCAYAPAHAGLAEGTGAYARGDYPTALRELEPLAAKGDRVALTTLGAMYLEGLGVERNDTRGFVLIRQAAEAGVAEAQLIRAELHASGRGTPLDLGAAAIWYEKAAQQGLARAQYNLGVAYVRGRGVAVNPETAAWWFEKAAAQGMADAQYNLGALVEHGAGTPKDPQRAIKLYTDAARQEHAPALHSLGLMAMEAGELKRAAALLERSADLGYPQAQLNYGVLLMRGQGVSRDYGEAYTWLTLARQRLPDGALKRRALEYSNACAEHLGGAQIEAARKRMDAWRPARP